MEPKKIVILVVLLAGVAFAGQCAYKKYKDLNPSAPPVDTTAPAETMPAGPSSMP